MAAQNTSDHLTPYPPTVDASDAYKASYDNLIDEYATPYSRHESYTIHAPLADGDPGFVHTQSYSSQYTSSKQSDDETVTNLPATYPPHPPTKDSDGPSLWQKIVPDSLACRLYVLTVIVETTIDLAIEGDILVRFHENDTTESSADSVNNSHKMSVYLGVFALAHVFQLIMAVDAVYARNTLQFICLTIFNALFLVYAIIQIFEIRNIVEEMPNLRTQGISHIPITILTTILPIFISIAELAYIGLGWKIYNEFGWKVYKFLGADRRIKKMYTSYQIFQCLIKFDVFFWVGFSVQFIWLVLQKTSDWEYYITCAALPVSLVLLVEGHLAARHENKWMMLTFMSGCVGAMVYFIYKLVKVIVLRDTPQFAPIHKSLITFSLIAIMLLIVTFVFGVIVMRNFGRGLKESFDRNRRSPAQTVRSSGTDPHRRTNSKTLTRMSIE